MSYSTMVIRFNVKITCYMGYLPIQVLSPHLKRHFAYPIIEHDCQLYPGSVGKVQ